MGTQCQLKMLSLNYHGLLIHPVLITDENVTILIDTGYSQSKKGPVQGLFCCIGRGYKTSSVMP